MSEFKRQRMANKGVSLTVTRGIGQRKHKFNTKLKNTVGVILEACEKELLTPEEEDQDVTVSLYREV